MDKHLKNKNILTVIDFSYFLYVCIYGAVSRFKKDYPTESERFLKLPDETDQDNLPDLLNSMVFRNLLQFRVLNKLEFISEAIKTISNEYGYLSPSVQILFAADSIKGGKFRKNFYPAYKLQRKFIKKAFKIWTLKRYIEKIVFQKFEILKDNFTNLIRVPEAEGDDLIAIILQNFKDKYDLRILFANDRDFLQLDDQIYQLDLGGKKVCRKLDGRKLTSKEYLFLKIILGDPADNISNVFKGIGKKKALKFLNNKKLLKETFEKQPEAISRFILNKKLISFSEIPNSLKDQIILECKKILPEIPEQSYMPQLYKDPIQESMLKI